MTDHIAWFEDLSREDIPSVGGKGANLGELTQAGLPVPGGFVVTAESYIDAMDAGRRPRRAAPRLRPRPAPPPGTPPRWPPRRRISRPGSPRWACPTACGPRSSRPTTGSDQTPASPCGPRPPRRTPPAPRSPGCTRRSPTSSATTAVIDRLVDCWASLYGERVIAYRAARGLTEEPVDRRRRAEHGRRRPGRGDVHRRPVDRRPGPRRDRGRVRAG